jgi:hypothetical protein
MDGHLLDHWHPVPRLGCGVMSVLATWKLKKPGTLFPPRAQHERATHNKRVPATCQQSAASSKRAEHTGRQTHAFDDAASALRHASGLAYLRLLVGGSACRFAHYAFKQAGWMELTSAQPRE